MKTIHGPNLVFYADLAKHDGGLFMDESAYGHLCTVTGATWGKQGRTFDGVDDQISIPDAPSLDMTEAITLDFWWYHQVGDVDAFLSKGVRNESWDGPYSIRATTTTLQLYLNTGAGIGTAVSTPQNTWTHVAFTYDRVSIKDYTNGVAGTPVAYTAAIVADNNALIIGTGFGTVTNRYVKGICGELRIYNQSLTPQEIQNIYLSTRWRYQ